MEDVTVVFTNGNIVNFAAQEFDVDLVEDRNLINKYPYKDAQGQDSLIHLKPNHVAGIFITRSPGGDERAITYTVGRAN